MKLYLSSYMFGNHQDEIPKLMPKNNNKIGFISNALDFVGVDLERKAKKDTDTMKILESMNLKVIYIDLKEYFNKKDQLKEKLSKLGGIFITGGNVFVLRQAMTLSKFDEIFHEDLKNKNDFLYSGYSAGVCVLAPNIEVLKQVDEIDNMPYDQIKEPILEGLNYLNYVILPHYKSDHPEAEDVEKTYVICKEKGIKCKPIADGEVIIIK